MVSYRLKDREGGEPMSNKNIENREPVTPTVTIHVKGGIAEVVRKDKGIRLIIVDKDGEQVGEGTKTITHESWDKVGKTPKGRKYCRFVNL
jgi:hypothetical protein